MKHILTCLFVLYSFTPPAQKPPITNATYKSWELLLQYNISADGKYVWYTYGSAMTGITLVLRSVDGDYKKIFTGVREAAFTNDSKHLVFTTARQLGIIKLGHTEVQYIPRINRFSLPEDGNAQWMTAQRGDTLLLMDLRNKQERQYIGVSIALFNRQGNTLVYVTRDSLQWIDLSFNQQKTIARKRNIANITFDHSGTALAFSAGDQSIYYFNMKADSATLVVNEQAGGLRPGFMPASAPLQFSKDDQLLLFEVIRKETPVPQDSTIITDKVAVWDYRDMRLHSQSPPSLYEPLDAVIPVKGGNIIQLATIDSAFSGSIGNQYVLVHNITDEEEAYWNEQQIPGYDILSLSDGKRTNVILSPQPVVSIGLSAGERFVTWFDPRLRHYFSYEISTGITRDISKDVPTSLVYKRISRVETIPYGTAGWLYEDNRLLIYDEFDVWALDPLGQDRPLNLTNSYGLQHQTTLRVVAPQELPLARLNDPVLITCLDSNKNNGFLWTKAGIAIALHPEPYVYYFPGLSISASPPPIKSKKAHVYILQRQNATQAPNLVVTTDFRIFKQLSDLQPQRTYNWLKAELVHWPMPDRTNGTGILYKPENFDSTQQYPVIFHYYEERSNDLNIFPSVRLSNGQINIPWYVSNGYLVFVPDIYRPTGQNGPSILNTITSAVQYLSSFPYVNTNKLGLQGHSFGGYETNYIITHCNLFAAAQSSAGPAELFGLHGGVGFGGRSFHYICEQGQLNEGVAPWQKPEIYLQESPVLSVERVTTPLLLMHNKEDGAVPFSQSVAMFTALRRLKKPVWLVEYEGEGHVLFDEKCQLDFNKRQQDFFGWYLKSASMSTWMHF